MKKKNKVLLCGLIAASFGLAGVLGLTSIHSSFVHALNRPTQNSYSLTLGSSNKVSTDGDHTIRTAAGGSVVFTYTNVSSNANGHTTIANGGTVVNKSQITSIESITATFTGGTLKARIAYVVGTWGDYFSLNSGSLIEFGSHPYYLEMTAEGSAVSLTSVVFTYTCQENPVVNPESNSGTYEITFEDSDKDYAADLDNSGIFDLVSTGYDLVDSFYATKVFAGQNGLKLGSSKACGSLTIDFDTNEVSNKITAITLSTAQYGSDSGVFELYLNDSYYCEDTTITPSEGGTVVLDNETTLTSLTIETSAKRGYLTGITLTYGGDTGPLTPDNPDVYEVGFTAADANSDKYTTNSIFDNDNALIVKSNKSNGTSVAVNPSLFSYVVKDSNDQAIDTSVKFPTAGTYTLVVTYSNYIPQEITLYVGEFVYPVDVTGSMLTTTFNTADILSEKLAANLTASITYSNSNVVSNISYAEFQANGLGVKLLSKNIVHEIDNPFGIPGAWTLRVYHTHDEANIYYDIALTVNAVLVEQITLNESTYELHPQGTLQLVATVGPSSATNDDVEWRSSNEDAATVDENGLVTAVAIGSATITATAVDGSGVYGSCVITVTAAPATTDCTIDATSTLQLTTNTTDQVVFTESPVTVTIDKNTSSTNANNYVANSSKLVTRVYTSQIFTISGNGSPISKIVIHGSNDKGVSGFANPTWTNASKSVDGLEITLTPTDQNSDVYCTISANSSFTGVTVTVGSGSVTPVTPVYPTAISLTGTNSITIGQTSQLTVGYTPSTTNVKNVTFTSSNSNVAGVSNTGLVTGVSQGTATITASAQAASGTVTATLTMTINPVSVTGVSLNETSATLRVGKTLTLIATVSPSNATNKNVTWSSGNTGIATVTNSGVVTGVSAGTTNITVTTIDGSKTARCSVTVVATGGEEEFSISYTDLPTAYQTGTTVYTAASGIKFQAYQCANYSSKMQFKASAGYLQNTENLELQSITINDRESNTLTVYGSNTAGSFSTEITGSNDVYDLTGYSYFKIARTQSGAAYCSSITVVTGTPTPTDPTNITLNPTSCEIAPGGSKSIAVTYTPSNANQNKAITWTSSNTSVATVDSTGKVTVKSTASVGQTATITAKLTNIPSISKTCTVTVVEQQLDDHTVLIYMCGADLESRNGLATGDLKEILSVSGQPNDVNIVVETGGASSWKSTYGISSSKLERWHVENKSFVRDDSLTYASMGLSSTLQDFVEYGLNNYPAERTGLIFWNHGGAMRGVCYDEKKSDDSLLTNEVSTAISGALTNCGKSGQKLEWVGYDACLMQVQDIASINSDYFNYMIASEESEAGYGWDYDTWVDDLYAKKSTSVILQAIVDGFIKDNGGVNSTSNDQTLSYLNLGYMQAYITAWNNMATQLGTKLNANNKSSFNTLVKSAKYYADSDYTYYGIFDAKDFINKLASNSTFNPGSSYTNAVLTAFNNLVAYSSCGKAAGNSYGLCMFWSISSNCSKGTYYTAAMTKFTAWRTLVTTYGS